MEGNLALLGCKPVCPQFCSFPSPVGHDAYYGRSKEISSYNYVSVSAQLVTLYFQNGEDVQCPCRRSDVGMAKASKSSDDMLWEELQASRLDNSWFCFAANPLPDACMYAMIWTAMRYVKHQFWRLRLRAAHAQKHHPIACPQMSASLGI